MSKKPFKSFLAHAWTPIILSACLAAIGVSSIAFGSPQLTGIVSEMMVKMIVVVGLYIFMGNSGVLSFGHVSFMSIGAYATAWFTCCTLPMVKPLYLSGLPVWLQETSYPLPVGLAAAAIIAGLVALVFGTALMRLSGIAASIGTFALFAMQYSIYGNWETVTAGTSSISNLPILVGPGIASLFAIGAMWMAFLYQTSRYGIMLRATRDDPVAARASGVRIFNMRLIAFVLSAAVVGVGGALYGNFVGILTVNSFYTSMSFLILAMLVVGGVGSLFGAVSGVVLITVVTEVFRSLERGITIGSATASLPPGSQEVILGILMAVILIRRPSGLTGGREVVVPRWIYR